MKLGQQRVTDRVDIRGARHAVPLQRLAKSFVIELTPQQIAILERIVAHGFQVVAFPLYANAVGVRGGSCAALLDPVAAGGFRLFVEPCMLVDGNLTVRIANQGRSWFVWKNQRLEATPERLAELDRFVSQLKLLLESRA